MNIQQVFTAFLTYLWEEDEPPLLDWKPDDALLLELEEPLTPLPLLQLPPPPLEPLITPPGGSILNLGYNETS